jgi:hypothetical protein
MPATRFLLDLLRSMFVAACAAFTCFVLIVAMQPGDGHDGPITPAIIVFGSLYLMLTPAFCIYLPLGAVAGLVWPLVIAGGSRLRVILRGAFLGLALAAAVGVSLAYVGLKRPNPPAEHPAKPPSSRHSLRELVTVEISLLSSYVGGYAGWAWLATRRLSDG